MDSVVSMSLSTKETLEYSSNDHMNVLLRRKGGGGRGGGGGGGRSSGRGGSSGGAGRSGGTGGGGGNQPPSMTAIAMKHGSGKVAHCKVKKKDSNDWYKLRFWKPDTTDAAKKLELQKQLCTRLAQVKAARAQGEKPGPSTVNSVEAEFRAEPSSQSPPKAFFIGIVALKDGGDDLRECTQSLLKYHTNGC